MLSIKTTEMHTGGEPLRIIESGIPEIKGGTVLEKRRYIKDHLDYIRRFLVFEPRGHFDMYGVYLVKPNLKDADMGAIFFHNEGYSTMCGHAVIALGRYAVDRGLVSVREDQEEVGVSFQCPCGLVKAFVHRGSGHVRFNSVPAFLFAKDVEVDVPTYGKVTVDISYGGAFYALVPASSVGLDVKVSPVQDLKNAAFAIKQAVMSTVRVEHPEDEDLAFLYGTIFTDGKDDYSEEETANICVFADMEVDRSPCGSGVTARIAQQFTRGLIKLEQSRNFVGPAGSVFTAKAAAEVTCGKYNSVVVEVSGKGHYTGSSSFTLEEDDTIGKGFLLK